MHDDNMPGDEPEPQKTPEERFQEAMQPKGPIDRLGFWLGEREAADQKAYVENPRRLRTMWRSDIFWFVLALVLIIVEAFLPEGSWSNIGAGVLFGWLIGRSALKRLGKAQAYRNGWLDGRRQMVGSMTEAMHRDFTVEEWLETELERDMDVLRHL